MQTERGFRFGLTVLVFSALARAAQADEIVIQRDGRRSQGSLTGCSEDGCTLNGARVPRSDIAWIGFDSQRQPPTSGRAEKDEIHLKDGRILRGSISGISRGAVGLEGQDSLDRDDVAWVRFAGEAPAQDALVFGDGTTQRGRLDGCGASTCALDGSVRPRTSVLWVGLGVSETDSPPAAASESARVVLSDGSVRAGELVAITDERVTTNRETYPRASVRWVYAVPPAATPAPRTAMGAPRPSPPPAAPSAAPPSPKGSPAPPPPPPPQPPASRPSWGLPPSPVAGADMGPCGPATGAVKGSGVIWTGKARVRESLRYPSGGSEERDAEIEVKLREVCQFEAFDSAKRLIATRIMLDASGSVTRESFKDYRPDCLCEGQGTHTEAIIPRSMIWRRSAQGDTTGSFGFDVPSQPLYTLLIGEGRVVAPCRGDCEGSAGGTMLQFIAGRTPDQRGEGWDPEVSWDPEVRNLDAGIMRGSYTKPLGPAMHEVAWSICREGQACPPPPGSKAETPAASAASPSPDPCGSPGNNTDALVADTFPNPGLRPRPGPITQIVVHSTGGPDCNPRKAFESGTLGGIVKDFQAAPPPGEEGNKSIHYIVGKDGKVVRMVPEDRVANHVGGPDCGAKCNSTSVGIELINNGDGNDTFPPEQLEALTELLRRLMRCHGVKVAGIKGHSDLDTRTQRCINGKPQDCKKNEVGCFDRRVDPGSNFPWEDVRRSLSTAR